MTYAEAIKHRRSVRTFDGNALSDENARRIEDFAEKVSNPYGQKIEWRLLDAKENGLSAPVISGAKTYIAGKLTRAPLAEEAFGYSFEKLLLYAETLGLGSTWIAGTMDRPAFECAMNVLEDEIMPCISPLGHPAEKMSLRETLMRKGVRADSRFDFKELFFDASFEKPLSPEKDGGLSSLLELVRLAPSAVNKQPWRVIITDNTAHFYEKRTHGFVSADGWDLQKVDVGIALCHFALGAEEKGLKLSFSVNDPGIKTPDDVFYVASYTII